MLSSLRASDLAIPRTWSLISFRFLYRCIQLGQTGHPLVLVVHRKTRIAKVSELESESNSASGGGSWESAGDVLAAPGIGGSTLAASQRGGFVRWN
jgi:hypothetical protein